MNHHSPTSPHESRCNLLLTKLSKLKEKKCGVPVFPPTPTPKKIPPGSRTLPQPPPPVRACTPAAFRVCTCVAPASKSPSSSFVGLVRKGKRGKKDERDNKGERKVIGRDGGDEMSERRSEGKVLDAVAPACWFAHRAHAATIIIPAARKREGMDGREKK